MFDEYAAAYDAGIQVSSTSNSSEVPKLHLKLVVCNWISSTNIMYETNCCQLPTTTLRKLSCNHERQAMKNTS